MKISGTAERDKKSGALYITAALLLAAGIIAGSAYLASNGADINDEIQTYLSGFFSSAADGIVSFEVFKNSLAASLAGAFIIFVMGFFRFGFIATGAVIIRKGFITGFTAASFIECYGIKGMLIMLSLMPSAIISIPVLLIFAAVSVRFSVHRDRSGKTTALYVLVLILTAAALCIAALAEGYLSTALITWFSPKFV